MYDIHSHVLPGIDDGAKTMAESLELVRLAHADGVRTIVATPHIREGRWQNNRGGISTRLEELRAEVAKAGIPVEVVLGAEVYFAYGIAQAIREGAFPTYADGRRYMLLELSSYAMPRQVQELVFELRTAGVTPVIAHPERNLQLMENLDQLEHLLRMGAVAQVTAMSVTGRFGREAKKAANLLFDRDMVHAVASDGHHPKSRPTLLAEAFKQVSARWGEARAREVFIENPRRIVAGEDLEPRPPAWDEPRKRGLAGLLSRVFQG
jgi:protein-tyrosine phosphatase